mmetsp:Transcript_106013/g.184341  ORF Transcript_106013/g.184341 Transcript_106013/m.184341 type:complete len:122 (-) Transcript_106013:115-480(-)
MGHLFADVETKLSFKADTSPETNVQGIIVTNLIIPCWTIRKKLERACAKSTHAMIWTEGDMIATERIFRFYAIERPSKMVRQFQFVNAPRGCIERGLRSCETPTTLAVVSLRPSDMASRLS